MIKSHSRIFLIISLLILISLACEAPTLSQILPDTGSSDGPEASSGDDSSTTSDTGFDTPHNTDGAELTFIPGATFQMGSPATDTLADEDELPQHQVTVDEFYIYTYEVTNQMYSVCVDSGSCLEPRMLEDGPTSHYGDAEFADNPVVGVDWVMARDYCSWAGSRLATEAEWELASRGPDSLLYPWGEEEPTCDYVNMKGCLVPPDTQQVGYYLMGNSPDEVWDMSGNVWEWVHDWYADDYYSKSPADNPIGPLEPQDPDKPLRGIRGGGLNSTPDKMRSATRMGLNPYRTFTDVGIRCVVGEGMQFPAAYDHGEDRHDDVPPDSADGDDDPDDDDDGSDVTITLRAGCETTSSAALVIYVEPTDTPFAGASTDTIALTCETTTVDGVYLCHDLPGSPGDIVTVHVHFSDGTPTITGTVEYPDCSVPFWIEYYCFTGEGGGSYPHLILHFPPGGPAFVAAAANGVDLSCTDLGGGMADCHGLPGSPGDLMTIIAAFDDGTALTAPYPHPFCLGPVGFVPPWDLVSAFCLYPDGAPPAYYAAIDTYQINEDWILPDGWSLTGVSAPKSCGVENALTGRWGCTFALGAYTDMTFCADWVGDPGSHCETFSLASLPGDCPTPGDGNGGDDDPVSGYCRPGPAGGCGTNPCLPTCPVGVNCAPCTIP